MSDPDPCLGALGEDELLRRLLDRHGHWAEPAAGDLGPGDDCAVVAGRKGPQLLKVDAVVEGVHWSAGTDPARVGRKALARVLSDVAAMGGEPGEALIVLAAPSSCSVRWVEGVYAGLQTLGRDHGVVLAGGELVSLPEGAPRQLSVFLRGRAGRRALRRDGVRPGHLIAVTGVLGNSFASGWHLDFEPRLAEGRWLAGRDEVLAAMDLSDGLASDLPRLAQASGVGYRLDRGTIPRRTGADLGQALCEGEDHELLLAVDAAGWEHLAADWRTEFPELPLTTIGRFTEAGAGEDPPEGGWQHFQSNPRTSTP